MSIVPVIAAISIAIAITDTIVNIGIVVVVAITIDVIHGRDVIVAVVDGDMERMSISFGRSRRSYRWGNRGETTTRIICGTVVIAVHVVIGRGRRIARRERYFYLVHIRRSI